MVAEPNPVGLRALIVVFEIDLHSNVPYRYGNGFMDSFILFFLLYFTHLLTSCSRRSNYPLSAAWGTIGNQ